MEALLWLLLSERSRVLQASGFRVSGLGLRFLGFGSKVWGLG